MTKRFNPAPGWPAAPLGWLPGPGWTPDPAWPPAPAGWPFVVDDDVRADPAPIPASPAQVPGQQQVVPDPILPASSSASGGLFGRKRHLEQENAELRAQLRALGVAERDQLIEQIAALRTERGGLADQVSQEYARRLQEMEQALQVDRRRIDADRRALESDLRKQQDSGEAQRRALVAELASLQSQLAAARYELGHTQTEVGLQEVGFTNAPHRLADSAQHKAAIQALVAQMKQMATAGLAVVGSGTWTVGGSTVAGAKMVAGFSKLMLRAYNNEADACVARVKPYNARREIERLDTARRSIAKLGQTMAIEVTEPYHQLRVRELYLTEAYLQELEDEREARRAERERLREEEIAQREFQREQDKLRKELVHYQQAQQSLASQGATEAVVREMAEKVLQVQRALSGLEARSANIRAGYVYVISNVGAFGAGVVKIGLTRRLEPMDRVRELGDASVPFRFDVHALLFADDAVGLETRLHQRFAERRVNLVNLRREFFYVTPAEVRSVLGVEARLVTFVEEPEADEWRKSEGLRSIERRELAALPA